jgi:biotin operon repressor
MVRGGKNSTCKNTFYFKVLEQLKDTTNLKKIAKDLDISKQNLNYYLRLLKQKGLIINKSQGLWEVTELSKNSSVYENLLPKDFTRGHAYIIEIKLPKEIKDWDKRIEILEKSNINYKLVGAMKNIPRIKVLGRKVWLCNNHIRIFDKKEESYYGDNSIEARKKAFWVFYKIMGILENKLGFSLKPFDFEWKKEHYALIKNDLAIQQNQKGEIWRISDETGEWMLIDDSLEKGGELELVGKKAFLNNPKLSKYWNANKETNFEVDAKFTLNAFNEQNKQIQQVTQNQLIFAENMKSHISAVQDLGSGVKSLTKQIKQLTNQVLRLEEENKKLRDNQAKQGSKPDAI